jgi:cytochrome c oxidase assembly protein subunit 15
MNQQQNNKIAFWLFTVGLVLIGMIALGGVTRLTGSGLSMVQWQPIMGVLPPLNLEQWIAAFDLYKTSPEFIKINQTMALGGFKSIFWFEYLHRLLGRLIGLLFLIPMVFFFIRYPLSVTLKLKLLILFILGGAQGLLGWYMVKSGLVGNPHVSQYRLVAHLGLALLLYASIMWTAFSLRFSNFKQRYPLPLGYVTTLSALCLLVFITILAGGFVAGTKAGFAFNTFPLMNGNWVPEGYLALNPPWVNLFENVATVQFNHRLLATLTTLVAIIVAVRALKLPLERLLKMGLYGVIISVGVQYTLGLLTLLWHVPIPIAALHQIGAVLLLTVCLFVTQLALSRNVR